MKAGVRGGDGGAGAGLQGQLPTQANPAVAVGGDRELGQVDVAVVAVGEHLGGRVGNVVGAADIDGGVLVAEVVQEQHGAGRVVGAVHEHAGRGGHVDVGAGTGVYLRALAQRAHHPFEPGQQ